MMRALYSLGIRLYTLGVRVDALFNAKARQMARGWKDTFAMLSSSPADKRKTAWFHASSLGEFEQARPVIELFKKKHPGYRICVSFFSPSGYEVRKQYAEADMVCYLPMDTAANAKRFVALLAPNVVFFVKYDFWFNYLHQLHVRQVPTFLFSSIFRPTQYFFKPYGKWFLGQLNVCYTHIFVQDEASKKLLVEHGLSQVSIAGDTRFDRVHTIAATASHFTDVEQYLSSRRGRKNLLAGSSWEPDEELLHSYLDCNRDSLNLILAPHVVSPSHIQAIVNLFGEDCCTLYSHISDASPKSNVLIIDTIGILSSLYQYADVAYIGGGFGRGIHNTLEAITFGKPVVFGPNYHKFKEAKDIIHLGGGFSFTDFAQLQAILDTLLKNDQKREQASALCSLYLQDNLGAAETIMSLADTNIKDI